METLKVNDFNLLQTLECGQCFNFERISASENDSIDTCCYEYNIIACRKHLHIRQEGNELVFLNASSDDVENIWKHYFDLDRNYDIIKEHILKADPSLKDVINRYYGIKILNQEFPETLISFIISQNKSIPQIKQLVRRISENYGTLISGTEDEPRYAFPDLKQLDAISEQDFRDMKTGFRAPYLRNAVDMLVNSELTAEELRKMSFHDAKAKLMQIKGVGDKVANCVLLFGLGFRNAFPVDVWIKRIMEELYFHKDTDKKVIEQYGNNLFGDYGGYAQQYLFIYAKNK